MKVNTKIFSKYKNVNIKYWLYNFQWNVYCCKVKPCFVTEVMKSLSKPLRASVIRNVHLSLLSRPVEVRDVYRERDNRPIMSCSDQLWPQGSKVTHKHTENLTVDSSRDTLSVFRQDAGSRPNTCQTKRLSVGARMGNSSHDKEQINITEHKLTRLHMGNHRCVS